MITRQKVQKNGARGLIKISVKWHWNLTLSLDLKFIEYIINIILNLYGLIYRSHKFFGYLGHLTSDLVICN